MIVGDKEIPKDKISKWKIKINSNISSGYNYLYIGISPNIFKSNLYNEYGSLFSYSSKVYLNVKGKYCKYNNHSEILKVNDIIEVIIDRKLGKLSYAINGIDFGIACSNIPKEDVLYPIVVLYQQGHCVEIV